MKDDSELLGRIMMDAFARGLTSRQSIVDAFFEDADKKELFLPVRGAVRGRDGVTHEIIGNFTVCGAEWAGQTRYGEARAHKDWEPFHAHRNVAVTCIMCLSDKPWRL